MTPTSPWIDLPPAPDSTPAERLAYRRSIESMDMLRDLGLPVPDFDRLRAWHRHKIEYEADRLARGMVDRQPVPPRALVQIGLAWWLLLGAVLVTGYKLLEMAWKH